MNSNIDNLLLSAVFLTISAVIFVVAMRLSRKGCMSKSAEHLITILFVMSIANAIISSLFSTQSNWIGGFLIIAQFVTAMLCHQYPLQNADKVVAELMAKKKDKP